MKSRETSRALSDPKARKAVERGRQANKARQGKRSGVPTKPVSDTIKHRKNPVRTKPVGQGHVADLGGLKFANFRSMTQKEHDKRVAIEMSLQGYYQDEIAETLGVSRSQVQYDLKQARAEWKERSIAEQTEAINAELERINLIEKNAWREYRRSMKDRNQVINRNKTSTMQGTAGNENEQQVTTEEQTGDPRYLTIINDCRKDRMKLLGIGTDKMDLNVRDKTFEFIIGSEIAKSKKDSN